MSDPLSDLTEQQRRAIELLTTTDANNAEVARQIGVHKAQLTRWKRIPAFAQALAEAAEEQHGDLRRHMRAMSVTAVSCLRDLLTDPTTDPGVRVRIAFGVLDRVGVQPGAVAVPERAPSPAEVSQRAGNVFQLRSDTDKAERDWTI